MSDFSSDNSSFYPSLSVITRLINYRIFFYILESKYTETRRLFFLIRQLNTGVTREFYYFKKPWGHINTPEKTSLRCSDTYILPATLDCKFFADGHYVACNGWPNMRMSLRGDGWRGIAPSNKPITMKSFDFWRCEKGLIRENWVLVDVHDQIGVAVFYGCY